MVTGYGESNVIADGIDAYIVHAQLPVEDATARMILGYGDYCEYIQPDSIRTLIKNLLKKTMTIYNE